jgi:hypothetical protein
MSLFAMGSFRFFVCLFLLLLSSASFASEIDLETGLVAHYKFDGDFTDSSGTGNHGAQQGGVTFVEGVDGQAAYFDGNDDYIIVPHSDSLALNRNLTLSIRLKPSYQQNEDCNECPVTVFTKDAHLPNNFSLWTEAGLQRIYFQQYGEGTWNEDNRTERVPVSFSSVNFHEIVVVKEISMVSVYFDGNKITEKNLDYDAVQQSGPLYIGYDGGWGYGKYKGVIDDLKIYNRALTELEVMQLVSPYDIDLDGLPNDYETANGLNPVDASDAQSDSDMDGLTALEEYNLGTSPTIDDTDRDTLPDGWEVENDRDPLIADYLVSLGYYHSCALDDTGVVCWGWNGDGQTDVPSLSNPTQVSSGFSHTCAIGDSGVVCWGNNGNGQATVPSLSNPRQVSLGYYHSCALDDSGVICWGNDIGQAPVPSLSNPSQISLGGNFSCALDDTGVVCWGDNYDGQTDVPSLSNPTQVSAGASHACALDDTGVVCWGYNNYGQIEIPQNLIDPDDDGFSRQNGSDAFPLDPTEWLDTDFDGIGNNSDSDDDNDGLEDLLELRNNLDPLVANLDVDNDGIANELDADNDNDGALDHLDAFPLNSLEQLDSDLDGIGNKSDADNDNDGVMDVIDLFPLDALESSDSDGDGVGDNADFFPISAEYSLDSDLDQMPDAWERKYGLNPTDASDALLDQDNDGLTALEEYEAGTIPLKILDIDANGSFDALTDGLIILRYAFGLRGENLVRSATAGDAMRTDAADVEAYLNSLVPGL